MENKTIYALRDMAYDRKYELPCGGFVKRERHTDRHGSDLSVLTVSNGLLSFSVVPERGLDIGEIFLSDEKISWNRDKKTLLHPQNVCLADNLGTGWLNGFYGAVASIGPELFGTPGEGYTLHGTASYSLADLDSVKMTCFDRWIQMEGRVPVCGYGDQRVFEKTIVIRTMADSPLLRREETTTNCSEKPVVLDDGYHIQVAGSYTENGGRYVLPTRTDRMLLRDSAPTEPDPLYIYPVREGQQPIRCYQYVPEPVQGLEAFPEINPYLTGLENPKGITAEMVENADRDMAGYLIRPLDKFPRSLIAKENNDTPMFALEPCRTRPNLMSQKITDGEAFYLAPQASSTTQILIGVTKDPKTIAALEKAISDAIQ